MEASDGRASDRFLMICARCQRPAGVRREWVGREVRCPHCSSILRVPPASADGRPARAAISSGAPKRQFNFGCPRCKTLLEAHTGVCGQPATCPTCAARLVVPHLDPRLGMPGAVQILDADQQDPIPMHAYAASGAQAPLIHRLEDGMLLIECPRCRARSDVDSNSCPACRTPFTIEAASTTDAHSGESWGNASLGCGIAALFTFPLLVPAGLALIFGFKSLRLGSGAPPIRSGVIGMILGLVSAALGSLFWVYNV